ncbi:hypothetical protein [Noviherbaspirillum pedocola]|uniref:Uncharacterized protein n=1 Tax=Noviherbaspirillum pedocola TaxID=2801341 RepID=A0A934T061_9BURK|nr:hypothetical protein [Noviherbaspirillum pedocola]MBK4736019.1 hypothetical protein [Noviherbaspirillum pedocola]
MGSPINTSQASQFALDTQAATRNLIEKANQAVWEAVRAIAASNDPLGPALFGVDAEMLQQFSNIPKLKMLPLFQTGVPIFELRHEMVSAVADLVAAGGYSQDKLFPIVMRAFGNALPLKQV